MNTVTQTPPVLPGSAMAPAMELALASSFGSVARWQDAFIALARAHADAPGRVELAFMPRQAVLVNRWAQGAPAAAATTLLDMPCAADAEAFVAAIDWPQAYRRYTEAVHEASTAFAAQPADVAGALLLDVRRAGVFEAATTRLPGASWRDPAFVNDWAAHLPADREIVVYCVYGHEVGRVSAMRLQAHGLNARFLDGGIDGWQRAGHPTVPKGEAS
jgi:superoxide dismutase, Fe-Mn family